MRDRTSNIEKLCIGLFIGLSACSDADIKLADGAAGAAGSAAVDSVQAALQLAAPVSVNVTADTSVRQSNPNINFGTTPTLDINRALVQVDPSALSAAVGATDYVVSAALRVSLVPDSARRVQRNLDVHRVLKPWTEYQATWNCAVDTNTGNRRPDCSGATAWTMTGAANAFVAGATTRVTIPASRTGTLDLNVTNDVRDFLRSGTTNYGWLLKTGQGNGSEVADLASRESATPPQLVLDVRRCSAALCDDMNACTADSCTATGECTHAAAPNGTACSDDNACTVGDQCSSSGCSAGAPAPAGTPCGSGLICNGMMQCVPLPPAQVVINETDSNSPTGEADFVELYNQGSSPADVSGWSIRDNDDTHVFVIPAGTVIPVGGYVTFSEQAGQLSFGLGGADSARLLDASTTLKDSYTWTAHASTSYGRCPNGTGAFTTTATVTKGAANDCGGGPVPPTFATWPGSPNVATADNAGSWSSNLSGLTYQPASNDSPAYLWAVQNGPSKLFKLEKSGNVWVNSPSADWAAGKLLLYPNGQGAPDSEGVTKPEWNSPFVYVATERDNNASGTSRLAILRFDTSAPGTTLTATHEWNLTATLPVVGANLGLEAVTYVPDAYLVAAGLRVQASSQLYDPNAYPNHGAGLFLVGVEADGMIYALALNHTDSTFTRIAAFSSGMPGVMGLEFDRDQDALFAYCDNTCNNRATLLEVQTSSMSASIGAFYVAATFNAPTGLPSAMNNESIALAPESECNSGQRPVFWSDDGATGGNSLRVGSINCGPLF